MQSKSITLTLKVSEVEPLEDAEVSGLHRVYMSHPKLEGRLEVVGSLSTLEIIIDSLAKETGEKPKGSVEGIITSFKELVNITRSIKTGGNHECSTRKNRRQT